MLDGFSARRAAREHDARRRGVPPRRRGGRAPLDRLRGRRLAGVARRGCSRRRSRFPADTAVVAVICDERAHPRMQPLSGLTVLTVGTLDDLSGLLAARSDVMSSRVSAETCPCRPRRRADGARDGRAATRADARAAHRRRVAVLRRGGGDRRCRRLADLPRSGRSCSWSASARSWPPAIAALAWRRRWGGWRVAGARGDRLLRARHPARRPLAPRRVRSNSCGGSATSASGRCSRGRTSSRSTCPSARTAICSCRRSSCSWWAPARCSCCRGASVPRGVRRRARGARRWSRSGCSSAARP